MWDAYFCDIPVYRCWEEAYYAGRDQMVSAGLENLKKTSGIPQERAPESYKGAEEQIRAAYGGPWTFNEVVGWVRLYAAGSHVGAHLWWVNAKRLRRKMRKTFYLTTPSNILAAYFTPEDSSERIFKETLAHLEAVGNEPPLKGRYVDLTLFRNMGGFINWRAILDELPHLREERPNKPYMDSSRRSTRTRRL